METEHTEARRMLVLAVAELLWPAMNHPSLAARNMTYHAEELMAALDAFYSGEYQAA